MKRIIAIAIGIIGLSACTPQQIMDAVNLDAHRRGIVTPEPAPTTTVEPVIEPPYFPPCDPATGYYETSGKDAITCVQPPMRTDCTDGQSLTKAGYFVCNQPPETTIPDPTAPPATK